MSRETVYEQLMELGHSLTNHLVGQISTVLDSALADERQAKAAKDLAKQIIWNIQSERLRGEKDTLCYHRKNPDKSGLLPEWLEEQMKEEEGKS